MEKKERKGDFRLPMVETVIVIGIFVILSVFLLRMFVTANRLSSSAENVSRAVIHAQAAAENIKGSSDLKESLVRLGMQKSGKQDGHYIVYYDKNWDITGDPDNESFRAEILFSGEEDNVLSAQIKVYDSRDKELCGLTVKRYLSETELDGLELAGR